MLAATREDTVYSFEEFETPEPKAIIVGTCHTIEWTSSRNRAFMLERRADVDAAPSPYPAGRWATAGSRW